MTDDRMALVELLQKSGDGDFLRAVAEAARRALTADFPPPARTLTRSVQSRSRGQR
jgi:hypothetical protein